MPRERRSASVSLLVLIALGGSLVFVIGGLVVVAIGFVTGVLLVVLKGG